jgi:hypothetical protein
MLANLGDTVEKGTGRFYQNGVEKLTTKRAAYKEEKELKGKRVDEWEIPGSEWITRRRRRKRWNRSGGNGCEPVEEAEGR